MERKKIIEYSKQLKEFAEEYEIDLSDYHYSNDTLMIKLMKSHQFDLLEEYIDKIPVSDKKKFYLFHYTTIIRYGNIDLFQHFHSNVSIKKCNFYLLLDAISKKKNDMVELVDIIWNIFFEKKKEVFLEILKKTNYMEEIAGRGNYQIYKFFVDHGYVVKPIDFIEAVYYNHFDLAEYILDCCFEKINVNLESIESMVYSDHSNEIVDYLLEKDYLEQIKLDDDCISEIGICSYRAKKMYIFEKIIHLYPLCVKEVMIYIKSRREPIDEFFDKLKKINNINKQIMKEFEKNIKK